MSSLADTLGATALPCAHLSHALLSRSIQAGACVSERMSLSSSTPPVTTPRSEPTEPSDQRLVHRYPQRHCCDGKLF